MTIALYQTISRFSEDPADIILPAHPTAFIETDNPEEAFRLSQHGVVLRDQPWHHHPRVRLPIRSTSVGDVLELPSGERLIVAMLGFKPWPPETPNTPAHHLAEAELILHTLQRTSLDEAQRQLLHQLARHLHTALTHLAPPTVPDG